MPSDLMTFLGATTRLVTSLVRDGQPARALEMSRVYDTDVVDLWDALTSAERLPRWFAPVSGDLRLGGRYQIEGNAGGEVIACDPPRHLALTWVWGTDTSWVTVDLAAEGDGARLTLRHEALLTDHWTQFGPGAGGVGWELALLGLLRHLGDPEAPRPPEADEAWATSPEALGMYREVSAAWGRAAVAAGEPEAEALAAAERTRAFYSGEAAPEGEA